MLDVKTLGSNYCELLLERYSRVNGRTDGLAAFGYIQVVYEVG